MLWHTPCLVASRVGKLLLFPLFLNFPVFPLLWGKSFHCGHDPLQCPGCRSRSISGAKMVFFPRCGGMGYTEKEDFHSRGGCAQGKRRVGFVLASSASSCIQLAESNALCPMPPLHQLEPTQPCRQSSQGNKQPYRSPCAGLLYIIGFSHWHPKLEALRAAKVAGCSTWSCAHQSTFPVFL